MSQTAMRIAGSTDRPLSRHLAFTIRSLASLSVPAGRKELWAYDTKTPHLAYRLRASGASAFYWYRWTNGKPVKHRIAGGQEITVEQARAEAEILNGGKATGVNPVEEQRRQRREAESDKLTLREIWELFLADKTRTQKASTIDNYRSYMEGPALSGWLDQPVKSITREIVFRRHRQLGDDSGHAYANAAMRVLRAVFNFALALEKVSDNPVGVLAKRWFKVNPRTGKIADDQLADWFKAIQAMREATIKSDDGAIEIPDETARLGADFLEFALFTGMRRGEVSRLTWDRVNLDSRTVSVVDTKNGKPLVLPLSGYLVELLERRKAAGRSAWVFPSPGRKHVDGYFSEPRYAIDRLTALSGISHSVHDLRRSFVSAATRQVPHAVVKALVNHTAKADDITLDYSPFDTEELRPHVEKIAGFFLSKVKG